ncbi:aromatic ring-hydroxylating dioxygenase subunit alpha [Pantoea sp. EA-12]|uniref:aromatic ring-hydroxylating oxygenase subunit alpha n=1 Tax=Pantoea sp. EA-12 TaxID=3043303 RepID=UPI0024B5D2E3|nr:aromatic ring-hydroxylating dioxygenase subunit alpha [Pantoea sp. EA-12]MDI9219701.1 aromatic ring-hydroxylating dioxygenase subunit alpha [Pantoea sp. EA-12]
MFHEKIDVVFDDGDSILARILQQQQSDASRAETLPPEAYNSDSFFRLEEDKVFRQDWLFVGHESQIAAVNDYFTLDIVGEPLLILRNEEGIAVFSNVCLHRWAPIAQGSGNRRSFVCPFHNWTYNTQGKLSGAPSMNQAQDFDRHQCSLPKIRHEVVFGMIFVTFNVNAPSIAQRLAPLTDRFQRYHFADLVTAYTLDYHCPYNWKMAIETFMECYHHAAVHRTTLEDSFPGRLSSIIDDGPGWTICHQPLRKNGELSEILTEGLIPFAGLSDEQMRYSELVLLYPNCLLSLNPDRITISAILPLSTTTTQWHRVVLVSRDSAQQSNFSQTAEGMKQGSVAIIDEDQWINAEQQRGSRSRLARPGRLSHLETTVWHLANYLKIRMAE